MRMREVKNAIFEIQRFNTKEEWNKYNLKMTGVDVINTNINTIRKKYLLLIINSHTSINVVKNKEILIKLRDILKLGNKTIFFYERDKKNIKTIKTHTYGTHLLIIPKSDKNKIELISNNIFNRYVEIEQKVLSIKEQKDTYIQEQMKQIKKQAEELFPMNIESFNYEDLYKDITENAYYCPKCDRNYTFKEPKAKCDKCNSYLIDVWKERLSKDYE